jgi:hypothetical protein
MIPKNQPKWSPSPVRLNGLILIDLVNHFQYGCSQVFGNCVANGHLTQGRQGIRKTGKGFAETGVPEQQIEIQNVFVEGPGTVCASLLKTILASNRKGII